MPRLIIAAIENESVHNAAFVQKSFQSFCLYNGMNSYTASNTYEIMTKMIIFSNLPPMALTASCCS